MGIDKILKSDKYTFFARFLPTIISLIPFFVFQYFFLDNLIFDNLNALNKYSTILHSFVIVIAIYISSIITRGFGKDLIEKFYFIKNNKFPTTQILLGKKEIMSKQQFKLLKEKIKKDFNIDLISKCSKNEKLMRIKDSVKRILYKVGHENKILNQYNAEYGFFRNLAGGFLIYFLITLLLIIFSYSDNIILFKVSLALLVIEITFMISSWFILDNYGTKYAEQLFSLYLNEVQE